LKEENDKYSIKEFHLPKSDKLYSICTYNSNSILSSRLLSFYSIKSLIWAKLIFIAFKKD